MYLDTIQGWNDVKMAPFDTIPSKTGIYQLITNCIKNGKWSILLKPYQLFSVSTVCGIPMAIRFGHTHHG